MIKKRILITGVAGFIGSNLADRLIQEGNYSIIGIDNLSYGVIEQVPNEVEFHKLDIRDRSIYPLFENIDFVFHLAAKNSLIDCQNDPVEAADINVVGTVNVFEASRKTGIEKVIYAESSALYEGCKNLPSSEENVKPESFYSISKYSTMYLASAYARYYKVKSTALRYFCVYGPRQDYRRTIPPVFSSFIIKLLKRERPIIYGSGDKKRDFVHVDDVNNFHILCMNDDRTTGNVYNLGSGINYSVLDIYQIISKKLERSIKPLFKPDLPGEAFANLADISKAKELEWEPKIELIDGLTTAIQYIKDEMKKGEI